MAFLPSPPLIRNRWRPSLRSFSLGSSSSLASASSRPIPSFLPSHRTLEFRMTNSRTQADPSSSPQPDGIQSHSDNNRSFIEAFPRTGNRREDTCSIRCTEIDDRGTIVASRSMSKSDICAQNSLQPRDLRRIDSRISNVVPSILVRKESIIFNVLNIRALIKANSVILFDQQTSPSVMPPSSSSPSFQIRSPFVHNLLKNLRAPRNTSTDLPYEFRALETMLGSVVASLEGELGVLKTLVASLLEGLERNIERDKLKQLLLYSRRLSSFNSRAILVQECLDEIIENDQDMADSYLSEKIIDRAPRDHDDHEELEQLLESFSTYVEEIVYETNIKSTEEIIDLLLDSNRNTLLALDLKVSIATMGLGTGALLASFFGMNLKTGLEQEPLAFGIVSLGGITMVCLAVGFGLSKLHRLRRIGLGQTPNQSQCQGGQMRFHGRTHQQMMLKDGILDWDGPLGGRNSSRTAKVWGKSK